MAYALSTFRVDPDDEGKGGRTINAGDEVSASDLNLDEEQFQRLIDNGSISEEEPKFADPTPHPILGTVDLNPWEGGSERELTEEEGEVGLYDNLSTLASGADMPEPGSAKVPESITQGEGGDAVAENEARRIREGTQVGQQQPVQPNQPNQPEQQQQ